MHMCRSAFRRRNRLHVMLHVMLHVSSGIKMCRNIMSCVTHLVCHCVSQHHVMCHTCHVSHTHVMCHTYNVLLSNNIMSECLSIACLIGYGLALVSRIDKMIGLFCKRARLKRQYSGKETYNLIDPTKCSHPTRILRDVRHI